MAKKKPEKWITLMTLFFTPHTAPNNKKTIQRKWMRTTISAKILQSIPSHENDQVFKHTAIKEL
jgi:hypothetical protein